MAAVWIVALLTLAAARLTRVLTTDKIGEPYRQLIVRRFGPESLLSYFAHCAWCTGMWIAALATPLAWWAAGLRHHLPLSGWWAVPALALTVSYLIGVLARADSE
ncbi:hypothetical protein QYN14_25350 [Rhodococcus ruber]|uniref:hypothetical protein n=1 Tax=Rhodococcus ruber TaxID=1830 RepID=UPI00265B20E2|nr:hypothetical protein [Rhodococcus ruber]WKK11958.1 hypothetical protein QYN14_25350 [Rhodococcus ruber]